MRKQQVDSEFVANKLDRGSTVREERSESLVEYSVFPSANSESGSFSLIRNETNPESPISIPTIFPANHSDSENDGISESNETSPRFSHNSNSIVSLFPPARSATDSPENYEIIITNPSITITTSFSIPLIFPPTVSETGTDDCCSESNQSPPATAQFSYPIASLFPPARSETDSSSSKNYEIRIGQILPTPNLRTFSFTELKVATNNFKPETLLGEGGFGQVFKGWLEDKGPSMSGKTKNFRPDTVFGQSKSGNRMAIAVRKLNSKSLQGFQEWQSEVNFLGRLSHPNLMKLLGYCWEDRELLLVYEFMQNGSLEDLLFRRGPNVQPLPWDIRLKIAIGAAQGLAFLHTSAKQVIHRDFKASKILLDGSYTAKILDFGGLAKLGPSAAKFYETTKIMAPPPHLYYGTLCYPPSTRVDKEDLYVKSDVYGFGTVLVEILTGLRAFNQKRPSGKQYLTDWIKLYLSQEGKLKQIMDPQLMEKYPSDAAFHLIQLALKCLATEARFRPSMKEILEKLEWFEAANERPREPRNFASHPMVH